MSLRIAAIRCLVDRWSTMRWLWLVVLLLAPLVASAEDMIGSGAHTCREAQDAMLKDPEAERMLIQWALGYITGTLYTASTTPSKKEFDLSAIKPDGIKTFLTRYCNTHPDKGYFQGVDEYLFSLPMRPAAK